MRLARFSRTGTKRQRTRGQSLVEFAIVLPIILFLTLIALDFGRVYLGWINLQSMSRIAANLAANNPTAWSAGDTAVLAKYQNQIRNDAAATNCDLPKVGGTPTAPSPVFADTTGNGSTEDIGDTARVSLSCTFHVITPGVANVLGGTVTVSASSVFPVKTGMTDPGAGGGAPGVAPNAAFTGNATIAPSTISGVVPFTVIFRDTSGGNPTGWHWVFNDGSPDSIAQDPLAHTFTVAGTYVVTMTASNSYGSSTASMGVTVLAPSTVDFTSTTATGTSPLTVTFTDASTPGGTAYAWTFGAGEGSGTGATASHTYSTAGTYTVTHTVTYPTGDVTVTKANYVTVAVALCTVPHLDGVKRNSAQADWNAAGFTGTVSDGPGAPNGNYTIKSQSLTATSSVPCSSSVVVNNP
jgi:PKD repeat protein